MFCKYECGYGSEDHRKNPNNMRSIKCDCLAHFSIKRLYTWPYAVEIIFYHWIHTWANGDPIHSACDPGSTSQMLAYVPCMSHKLKEFIWTQLGLKYIVKQTYDKHKEIWSAWANVGQQMIQDDFLQLQDISYLDQKHKKGIWCLHKNLMFSIQSWVCDHHDDVFYFQDASEVNGSQVPFTIGI